MELVNTSYKDFHEQYMKNLNGTSRIETFGVVIPSCFSVLFVCIIAVINEKYVSNVNFSNFWIEFIMIVVTAILSFTVCADYIIYMILALFILCSFTVVSTIRDLGFNFSHNKFLHLPLYTGKKSFITNFRAFVCILTAICILAVDFTVFPRRFAKTETFGFSLMDTGVGLFCVSNSIVVSPTQYSKDKSTIVYLSKVVRSCLPLVILGGIRFFTTKQVDYQMHVSEYGVHWNFFITLAFSKVISSLILRIYDGKYTFLTPLIIIIIHEIILQNGIEDWVLSDVSRDNFINANREGIASLLGYVALFIAGISIRNLIAEPQETINLITLNKKFLILSIFLWSITSYFFNSLNTSRRLVNFGYFLWILTFSVSALVIVITIDLLVVAVKFCLISKKKNYEPQNYAYHVPVIFDSINSNGLAFFLIANIFTGIVNLSIQTLTVGEIYSIIILVIYMFLICRIMHALFLKSIKLKVW